MENLKPRLIEAIRNDALLFGDFHLRSGGISKYYVNLKRGNLRSRNLPLFVQGLVSKVGYNLLNVDAFGGPMSGADPLVSGILMAMNAIGHDCDGFLIRPEPKDHGTESVVEGRLEKGMLVVVVEDVTTTGASALKAVEEVMKARATVLKVLAVLDRGTDTKAKFREQGLEYESLLHIDDVLKPEER
jgi:orotate phosphoribosyltransferase